MQGGQWWGGEKVGGEYWEVSLLAREGAGCGSVGDVPGAWLASAPQSLLKLMSIESVMPSHQLILCHPLLLLGLLSRPSMGFSRQEYWSWVPSPSPNEPFLANLYSTSMFFGNIHLYSHKVELAFRSERRNDIMK